MGLVSDPDIETVAMYSAQVATLGLELYEMPEKLSGRGASWPVFIEKIDSRTFALFNVFSNCM